MIIHAICFGVLSIVPIVAAITSQDLPTNYGYYTSDPIVTGLSINQPYFTLNGKNITIYSGTFHYFRCHPSYWRDRLKKIRAAGMNCVETYVPWNLHEPYSGVFDFGHGASDFEEFLDIDRFLRIAQEEDLFVLLRPGPYICAEWEFGGMPGWLLGISNMKLRRNDDVFISYVSRYLEKLFQIIVPLQFNNGGPVIAVQVENEYGNTWNIDPDYLRTLAKVFRDNGIVEMLYTSDPLLTVHAQGALPGELLITANFNTNATANLDYLITLQENKPTMVMEYWSGWFDHYTENHTANLVSLEKYMSIYEDILSYPSSVNIYMFVGGTNWGFTNGAGDNSYGLNNSGLSPSVTSYDYDGLVTEQGQITAKWNATKDLVTKYNPVPTKIPDLVDETSKAVHLDDIKIDEQILLSEIIDQHPIKIINQNILPMENLTFNNGSGQNFGYIVYRRNGLHLKENATLKITGYVRDHVLALLNGRLLNPLLTSLDEMNGFGYWIKENSTIMLTSEKLYNVTLDLVVENNGRNNFGLFDQFQQFKGLIDDVLIDDEVIYNWTIVPLEFRRRWNEEISGWHEVIERDGIPALYKVSFNASAPLRDTFINVQDWRKGIVIINGFVLGRVFSVGPQQSLYLPAGLMREGINDIIILEHFSAPEFVKFSSEPIWGYGSSIIL